LTPEEIKRVLHPLPRNEETEAETHIAYEYAKKQVFRLQTYFSERITFGDKRKHKPLQAADSLTYDFNKMFRLRIANPQAKLRGLCMP
jgi:hypothetical protein